jgi:hypothetical protein
LRDVLRNDPSVSAHADEDNAQGTNVQIRGFSARYDMYLDGQLDFGSAHFLLPHTVVILVTPVYRPMGLPDYGTSAPNKWHSLTRARSSRNSFFVSLEKKATISGHDHEETHR